MIKRIAFTMYSVRDMARARNFYEKTLGLTITRNNQDKWVEYDLGESSFALTTLAEGVSPSANSGGSIAFEVENVDTVVEQFREKGVKVLLKPFSTPVCRMAVVMDSEGNAVALHQVTQDW